MKKNSFVVELLWIYGISGGSALLVGYAAKILEINDWGYVAMLMVFLLTSIVSTTFLKFWKENEKYAVSFENREIFLEGEMNSKKCATLFFQILRLNRKNKEPIKMFVDSDGGEIDGFRILANAITSSASPIIGVVIGRAYSSAALTLQCCHKRLALPHTKLFFHQVQNNWNANYSGPWIEILETVIRYMLQQRKEAKKDQEKLDNLVTQKSGLSLKQLESIEEKYLTPEEALKLNLIDEIVREI